MWSTLAAGLTILTPLLGAVAGEGPAADGATPKRVLILYSHRQVLPITLQWDRGIRGAIEENYREPVAIDVEYLDALRLEDATLQGVWVGLLRGKYEHSQPDLVIPVHDVSASLFVNHYQELFPDAAVVFCSLSEQVHSQLPLTARMTGVIYRLEYRRTVECALRLWPNTRNVVVVSGTGRPDNVVREEFQSHFAGEEQLGIEYWTGIPTERLCEDARRLPQDSVILYLAQDRDRDGRLSITPLNVLQRISSTASVPVFGLYDTLLDQGIIGGCLAPVEEQGRLAGQIAARILHGENPADIPFVGLEINRYMFDHRQLRRWGIRERDLPEGSLVLFRAPSIWQQYGAYLATGVTVIGLQMVLIAALLVNRTRRLRAESALADRLRFERVLSEVSSRLVHVSPDLLASRIEEALNRVLEHLGLDRGVVFELSRDGSHLRALVSVVRAGKTPPPVEIALDSLPWMWAQLNRGNVVKFSTLSLLPEAAAHDKQFLAQLGLKAGMAASLNVQGIPFGMVAFGQLTYERDWDDTIVQRLKLVGEVLADALAQARADEELATSRNHAQQLAGRLLTAQEDERRRLAREMHDDVSQRLAVAAIEAGNVEQQLATDPTRGLLSQLRARLIALSDDVHRISRRLHPSILDDLGLTDAIRSECDRISELGEIAVDFHGGQLPEHVPKDLALCLYRVAQETLRNAVKHSRTQRIDVTLNADAEFLYLEVRDYGCGFDPDAVRGQPGLGLASMEERVRLADGDLAINTAPGKGTSVAVTVPLPPE
jgi:signal transduction histidine kinase/ABC-type uncharacterized transport system substrate-binding protein